MLDGEEKEKNEVALEVSIVLCTLDRATQLGNAIRSILEQDCDPRRYEIVVVDNCSKDRTPQVVQAFQAHAANVRYVYEGRLGLSTARNRGTAESRAPIVAFFDDDGTADPGWLEALLKVFREDADAGAAGGLIHVGWPAEKPLWMPVDFQGYYGACDYGNERRRLAFPQYPYGANMMIRRQFLEAVGGFNDELGAKGQNIMQGDELDVFQRLFAMNTKVVYEPRAVVHHWVPAERVTRKWLLRRAYKHGFSNTRLTHVRTGATRLTWVSLLLRAIGKSAWAAIAAAAGATVMRDNSVVTSRIAYMTYWAGVARGARDGLVRGSTITAR
ncbi:MAG TPA: glycosyltransferase family A protein [Steroidobacteraceae bacterium]|nr:glycosyltransferase family A protein [Steroidobacteraceae bacterium]